MAGVDGPVLTDRQLSDYEELGFLHSLPILSATEVDYYRAELDRTCDAIGGRVPRFNGLHLFFQWALDLATHPIVDSTEVIELDYLCMPAMEGLMREQAISSTLHCQFR